MKTILCYGDSNTWGFIPEIFNPDTLYIERYPRNVRWTGILQKNLGNEYYIVEEGLNGRTTNVDSSQPGPSRNGKTFLPICLYTHAPIDLIILMLGVNDLKIESHRDSAAITAGLAELVDIIQASTYGPNMSAAPQILLVGNPTITQEESFWGLFKGALAKAKDLNVHYSKLAQQRGCYYADAGFINFSSIDGIHLDKEGHRVFGEWIAEEVKTIL